MDIQISNYDKVIYKANIKKLQEKKCMQKPEIK